MNAVSSPSPDAAEIARALRVLHPANGIVELRALHSKGRKRTDAGYFDVEHREQLIEEAMNLNRHGAAVYVVMNPLDVQLLARHANRVQEYAPATATDANVVRRHWFLVDIDPQRPKDTSSTEAQLEAAKDRARKLYSWLADRGWPKPVAAESGNGMHLFYRIDLANDESSRDLVKGCLEALAVKFDDSVVKIDKSVFNAARIVKIHGTVACKGDNIPAAPWRLSRLSAVPEPIELVSVELLQALAAEAAPKPQKVNGHSRPVSDHAWTETDVAGLLARGGIEAAGPEVHDGALRWKLKCCPFNPDHGSTESAVFLNADGRLGFKCMHNSCADRHWADLRSLVDGSRESRSRRNTIPAEPPAARARPRGADTPESPDPTFLLLWFASLHDYVPGEQIVKGLLLAGSLFVVYGESNSGKTFFMLDLALAVASGSPWRGRRVVRGLVIYVAGEGAASVRARVAAYRIAHPDMSAGVPFAIVPQAVNFLDAESVATLTATIRAAESECGEKAVLIIIDTFARALPGADENSAQDVGTAVTGADQIRVASGAAVGFVHHAGKDPSKGARGSSALRAATDTEILIEGVTGPRTASITKQRDLETGEAMPFELVSVQIGTDPDDGSPLTSCVVRPIEAVVATPALREFRGKAQRQLLAALRVRSEAEPDRVWTLMDLRRVGREIGLHKNTASSVVDTLTTSAYMVTTIGGYRFTDGRADEDRKGPK